MSVEGKKAAAPNSSFSFFTIPAPVRTLFKLFPLRTLPESPLPTRAAFIPCTQASTSSSDSALPHLHVFIHPEGARSGRPSFNPSCLRVQTLLALAGIQITLVPSTNHASPTGSLPFLLPPATPTSPSPAPIATEKQFLEYISSNGPTGSQLIPSTEDRRAPAYKSLIGGPIRCAWLYALYLSPANTPLLTHLYLEPTTSSTVVHAVLRTQLAHAARSEIQASTRSELAPDDPVALYSEARTALGALESVLAGDDWFFGAQGPQLFDAEVYAYTELLLGDEVVEEGLRWGDRALVDMLGDCKGLVRHRERMAALVKGHVLL